MSGKGQMRVRKGLVVAQVALSMLLVAAGGLFARSLMNLRQFDPGFSSDGLVEFAVEPSLNGYTQPRIQELLARIQDEALRLPGVRTASMATVALMAGNQWSWTVAVDGYQAKEGEDMNPEVNTVGPRFFETLGVQMILGREFTAGDRAGAAQVAIVNETFQRYFYGNESAVGRRITMGGDRETREIVGVVRDMKTVGVKGDTNRLVYLPLAQQEQVDGASFYLRTSTDAATPGAAIRDMVRAVDPTLPIFDVQTMEARMSDSLFADRLLATLSTAFAVLATLLAAVGLYGVMSYAVARRRKEIGVRTALFGMSPLDPVALAGATVLLSVVIFFAGWMPARKASRIEPLRALRTE